MCVFTRVLFRSRWCHPTAAIRSTCPLHPLPSLHRFRTLQTRRLLAAALLLVSYAVYAVVNLICFCCHLAPSKLHSHLHTLSSSFIYVFYMHTHNRTATPRARTVWSQFNSHSHSLFLIIGVFRCSFVFECFHTSVWRVVPVFCPTTHLPFTT